MNGCTNSALSDLPHKQPVIKIFGTNKRSALLQTRNCTTIFAFFKTAGALSCAYVLEYAAVAGTLCFLRSLSSHSQVFCRFSAGCCRFSAVMGDHFIVFRVDVLKENEITLDAYRAQYKADVTAPPLGQQRSRGKDWDYTDIHDDEAYVFALFTMERNDASLHCVDITLFGMDDPSVPAMKDAEATTILAWAEKLCSATAKELTPWLNDADRRPHDKAKNIITKLWSEDADLWKCSFARILINCNPQQQKQVLKKNVVRDCRRAVVSGYTPCSEHMWDHKDTTNGDRVEIVNRWGKEALVRRLVYAFNTEEAANDNNDDDSFGAVRRLLALYLYVSAITQGRNYPNFKTAGTHDFREDQTNPEYTAVFVKSLHS